MSQEQTVVSTIPPKNFCVQGVQSIVGTPVISDEFVPESAFLATGDPVGNIIVLIYFLCRRFHLFTFIQFALHFNRISLDVQSPLQIMLQFLSSPSLINLVSFNK